MLRTIGSEKTSEKEAQTETSFEEKTDVKILLHDLFGKIPDHFKCEATGQLMKNPVVASDGKSYEQNFVPRKKKIIHTPIPNILLKQLIELFETLQNDRNKLLFAIQKQETTLFNTLKELGERREKEENLKKSLYTKEPNLNDILLPFSTSSVNHPRTKIFDELFHLTGLEIQLHHLQLSHHVNKLSRYHLKGSLKHFLNGSTLQKNKENLLGEIKKNNEEKNKENQNFENKLDALLTGADWEAISKLTVEAKQSEIKLTQEEMALSQQVTTLQEAKKAKELETTNRLNRIQRFTKKIVEEETSRSLLSSSELTSVSSLISHLDTAPLDVKTEVSESHSSAKEINDLFEALRKNCLKISEDFMCSIALEPMQSSQNQAVITVDGHTYGSDSIKEWFKSKKLSPLTGSKLKSKALLPNTALQNALDDQATLADNIRKIGIKLSEGQTLTARLVEAEEALVLCQRRIDLLELISISKQPNHPHQKKANALLELFKIESHLNELRKPLLD